jgi:hypothetical protein
MVNKQELFESVRGYLMHHPEELVRVVKNSFLLRFGLPLDAVRWLAARAGGRKAPKDVQIEAVPPGVRVGATLELMGNVIRASAIIYIEDIRLNSSELRIEVRLADVALKLLSDTDSPVATLIKSGALDLSKPGNLAAYMPKRPAMLIEAADDRVVIDLMKHPAFGNQKVEKILGLITPLITVDQVRTDWEHLDVVFKPFQNGVAQALEQVRGHL